ncbi:MAG: hypothetical protein IH840_04335, partial [Candidatus Heimdallarchaeota archaeon]|nr:hypothetical protein [Candidatus Heimdallarchaeota archaeon]
MPTFKIGYRVLISNYGYFGSIAKKYVGFEIKGHTLTAEVLRKFVELHALVVDQFDANLINCKPNLNAKDLLEHALTYFQSYLYDREFPCLHLEILNGSISTGHQNFLLTVFENRTVISELMDHFRSWLNGDIEDLFPAEIFSYAKARIPDKFIFKLLGSLKEAEIEAYDVEADSSILAIGEGRTTLIIRKHLIAGKLSWIGQPFPNFENDLDSLSWQLLQIDNQNDPIELAKMSTDWTGLKSLLKQPSIPKFLITGTNGKTTTARMIAYILKNLTTARIGLASTRGIFVDNEKPDVGDFTGPWSARIVLQKEIDIAVLETARGGLIREGVIQDGKITVQKARDLVRTLRQGINTNMNSDSALKAALVKDITEVSDKAWGGFKEARKLWGNYAEVSRRLSQFGVAGNELTDRVFEAMFNSEIKLASVKKALGKINSFMVGKASSFKFADDILDLQALNRTKKSV